MANRLMMIFIQQKIFKNKNKHVQTMTNFVGIIENVYLELYVGIVSLRRPKNVNISEIAIPIKCHLLKQKLWTTSFSIKIKTIQFKVD